LLTSNVTEYSPSALNTLYFEFGTHEWIKHVRDIHWFKLSESPTNIIFFPLHFSKKYSPLNLDTWRIAYFPTISEHEEGTKKEKKHGTWANHMQKAAICTWDRSYHGGHTFDSWTVDLWTDNLSHREDILDRKPIFLWTSCTCQLVL